MASFTSTSTPVKIAALGGLGEIGLNLMVLECAGEALVIDAGLMFPEDRTANGLLVPDLTFLERTKPNIRGIVLTHAHEDHVGALAHLLGAFPAPIFGSEVTLAFARRRLQEAGLAVSADLRMVEPRRPFECGPFVIEPVRVTHSTPDSYALAIRSPAGLIVHSGDFKIDETPVDGERFDRERFGQLGEEGVMLLLSDSTNVERPGRSGSESSIMPTLRELISRTRGKFFLSAFSSHLHRIRQVAELSREFGRRVVPLGRRMSESTRLGIELGQFGLPVGTFIDRAEAEFFGARELTFLVSGSQGEPLSALVRIATDAHPRVRVEKGDTVVLSSRFIPGNERTIHTLINHLYKRGADVYYETVAPVHVSGHACREELAEMIRLTRPCYFVPIHGEYRHLVRHVALAIEGGIPEQNCFVVEDGGTLLLSSGQARRGQDVEAGREFVEDGEGDPEVMRERQMLGRDGAVVAVIAISLRTGEIVAGPDLLSRGFVQGNGTSPVMDEARARLTRRFKEVGSALGADHTRIRDEVRRTLSGFFAERLSMRPLVVPCVMEVGEEP
jgi:ribonuclease J